MKRVVVLGGGPTGLYCADRLRHHFEVTVVDSKEFFEFTPGILRALVEPTHLQAITFDYREVLEKNLGVEFVLGEASRVDTSPAGLPPGRGSVTVSKPAVAAGSSSAPSSVRRLHFDYCVVAVGVSNGVWKPRLPREMPKSQPTPGSGAAAAANGAGSPSSPVTGSQSSSAGSANGHSASQAAGASNGQAGGSTASKGLSVDEVATGETTLEARRRSLRALRERLVVARGAIVVGAGLVGVELAAELTHFFPWLKVTLVDGAPCVLPQLAESARTYAHDYLLRQGVKLKLGKPFVPEFPRDDEVVLWCVGTRPRSNGLFVDTSVLRPNGQVRVNRKMQVLRRVGSGASTSDPTPGPGAGAFVEMEPLGGGRVFAVGDAAAVEGVATAQIIFHGEEMAAIAVSNIEAAEDITSPFAVGNTRREAEPGQPLLACTSLGPQDGMFSTQSELIATGALAALQKQLIEGTKMGALRGELLSSIVWMPVH